MTTQPAPRPEPPLYLVLSEGRAAYIGNEHTAAELAFRGAESATMFLSAATQRHIHGEWTSTAAFHIEQQWRGARDERDHARARLADLERRMDIARAALDAAIQRAAQRGDLDEIEALHRCRRLLGFG